ncbi:MBL fold metallo-hydrolase [Flavobacterium sp. J27]|uniref:MBL fold metallo-hydrolase n=1 Tax=Flavobacterium sp. J27 TaxID=2060419 RepID=UPI0010309A17|nr:MBL fold metallo-hydrolase [Flavobacterium sp. J27]
MKTILKIILITLSFIVMDLQAQNFKSIVAGDITLNVYYAAPSSFGVTSVIISGQNEAVLIDAQFTLADAENVAQEIKKSGKKLTTIFISHGDPDFYFGLEVFKRHFPEAIVYATEETVEHIKLTEQKKLDVWGAQVGDAITKNVVLPQVLKGNSITLENKKLEIIGSDNFAHRTFVWIPSIKAVVGGINVFGDTFHVWMAEDKESTEKDARKNWIAALDKIRSLQPKIVIPTHIDAEASLDIKSVTYTKEYILFYKQALKTNATSESLIKTMQEKYPNAGLLPVLEIGAKVNTGEMKW